MGKMRIAVLTSSFPRFPGDGTAPFVKSISEHLVRQGHDVETVAPYDSDVRPMEMNGVRVHRFRYIWPPKLHIIGHARSLISDVRLRLSVIILLPFFLIAAFATLMRVTKRQKSQVIYVHWVLPNGLVATWVAAIRKIPFIISVHGSDIYIAQRNWLFRTIARSIFERASAVTACSPELRRAAIALHAPENTLLLAWGADPVLFHPTLNPLEYRRSFGLNQSALVIAALGRMVYKKGFSTLIMALPDIISRYPRVRLVFGGDGPLREELSYEAERLGVSNHVSFIGRIPWNQVPEFLATADIFVLPSVKDKYGNVDGLPTVLLESMSCGTPVIASDIGGVRLVVEHDRNGLLVPPDDVSSLVKAIALLAGDPEKRHAIGQAARHAIEQQFNWSNVTLQLVDVFKQTILV
jgi:glycosyltransferase involved in cell wall biosynthesis